MRVLIPGGCGYLGTQLSVHLVAKGWEVFIIDPEWFGNYLPDNENIHLVEDIPAVDAIVYLAGLTNDSQCEKHSEKAFDTNVVLFEEFVEKTWNIKNFVFLSSVAAYGNSRKRLTEKDTLNPTTIYGVDKRTCERYLKTSHRECTILRPAGVCGYSGRMRFDLTVNRMVRDAYFQKKIHIHGGNQYRPHVHIRDLIDTIIHFIETGKKGIYNVVHDNQTVLETARRVSSVIPCELVIEKRQDNRSYKVDWTKLEKLGLGCRRTIEEAAEDLYLRFREGYWTDAYSESSMNIISN